MGEARGIHNKNMSRSLYKGSVTVSYIYVYGMSMRLSAKKLLGLGIYNYKLISL